jgi:hypothetical protein
MRAHLILLAALLSACGSGSDLLSESGYSGTLTIGQIEELRSREALLPIAPDSVIERYRRYPPPVFYQTFSPAIVAVAEFIDTLNQDLPPDLRIDTLAIDHTFENIGSAGRTGTKLYLSSSFFFIYDNRAVLRSVITHEYGHIHYDLLTPLQREELVEIWTALQASALFYVFLDGEYSANARFGGHPQDTPEELFASAFNLFRNNERELQARLQYVDPQHYSMISRLRSLVESQSTRHPS